MGSIGTGEILMIFLIALLLFGPQKLPELGRALGRAVREFKKAEAEIKEALREDPGPPAEPGPPAKPLPPAGQEQPLKKKDG